MPNNLENNDSIIKKIVIENNGTYDQANIGTSAEYVDYNNTSVADTLDNIQQPQNETNSKKCSEVTKIMLHQQLQQLLLPSY